MRDRHVFMWLSVKVLNVFNTLTLIHIFWKTKTFLKKLKYSFLFETPKIENTSFPFKATLLRQMEWGLQNGLITKNGVLLATT